MPDRFKVIQVKNNEKNSLYLEGAPCVPMSFSSLKIKITPLYR